MSDFKKKYSASTKDLVKEMMKESKLTKFQQNQLEKKLNEGGSLPSRVNPTASRTDYRDTIAALSRLDNSDMFGVKTYSAGRKKKQDTMVREGAYEPSTYKPKPAKFDREKEKNKLTTIFEYNGKPPRELIDPNYRPPQPPPVAKAAPKDRFQELVEEIEERKEWLESMRELGQAHLHEHEIRAEISERLQEMKKIDKERSKALFPAEKQKPSKSQESVE